MPELALAFFVCFFLLLLLLSNWEGGEEGRGGGGFERTELDAGGLVISSRVSQTSTMGHEYRDLVIVGC